jgi:hypothetical protein
MGSLPEAQKVVLARGARPDLKAIRPPPAVLPDHLLRPITRCSGLARGSLQHVDQNGFV